MHTPLTPHSHSQQLSVQKPTTTPPHSLLLLWAAGQEHVDATSDFNVLLNLKLGQHSILMAAEMDAALPLLDSSHDTPDNAQQQQRYVELKTYRHEGHSEAV